MSDSEAVVDAEACLQCGGPCAVAPCVSACPAAIDIPGFILDIARGKPIEAARKIFAANILGGSCARVCPVQVLCQGSCVLHKEGRKAIQIGRLQRYATDKAFAEKAPVTPPRSRWTLGQSIGVIGAGPAGLACAAELAKMGYPVVVYEQRDQAGGLITFGIAPYKQLVDPVPQEVEAIRAMGVEFRFGVKVGRDITFEQLQGEHAAVFLGVGMGDDLPAKIPGENLPGVWESLPFIEQLKLGKPGSLRIGPRVAVIGGGNTAIDVAREARMMGVPEVMMLYRRTEAQMPAYAHEIADAKAEGVQIISLVAPLEFVGKERVQGVRCLRMKLGAPDASGRPRPEPIAGSEFTLQVETVIKAIGQKTRTEFLSHVGIKPENGVIKITEEFQTDAPDTFAAGDAINGGATVVEAVRDGKLAARAIDRYLTDQPKPGPRVSPAARVEQDNGTIRHFQGDYRLTTVPVLCKGCNVCVTGCPTQTLFLNGSNRITVENPNTCIFCGLCEARCPDFAIWVVKGTSKKAAPAAAESEPVS